MICTHVNDVGYKFHAITNRQEWMRNVEYYTGKGPIYNKSL